jgi:hypothetical protein
MANDDLESKSDGDSPSLLNAVEARILGAMMEKELTTPENYPLTLNSLPLACNQKLVAGAYNNSPSGNRTLGQTFVTS